MQVKENLEYMKNLVNKQKTLHHQHILIDYKTFSPLANRWSKRKKTDV